MSRTESFDLETKDTVGSVAMYRDFSGNGFTGSPMGSAANAPARFGQGARLPGPGSYVAVGGPSSTLNLIDGSMTVASWIRPDTDYVSGTGWQWSFGRYDLWRLGFADGKVRFEVQQAASPYTVHAAEKAYPLYAGRWYHLAGTMTSGAGWTNLSAYANGGLVAWKNESAYAAKDGTASLYVGHDPSTRTSFKGIVDEFRLYKTSLSADGVRGLAWFLHGSNNLLVPRGACSSTRNCTRPSTARTTPATRSRAGPCTGTTIRSAPSDHDERFGESGRGVGAKSDLQGADHMSEWTFDQPNKLGGYGCSCGRDHQVCQGASAHLHDLVLVLCMIVFGQTNPKQLRGSDGLDVREAERGGPSR